MLVSSALICARSLFGCSINCVELVVPNACFLCYDIVVTVFVSCRLLVVADGRVVGRCRVNTAVQSALKDAVSRVLTPKKSVDVLREVCAQFRVCLSMLAQLSLFRWVGGLT